MVIHEIYRLIKLDAVNRSHNVIWRWNAQPRTEGYSTYKVCYLVNAQDLLFWMFMESPAPANGNAGRVRPKSEPDIPGAEDGISDASLLTVVAAPPKPVVPPEQPAPIVPTPDPFAPGSAAAGGQPISFFVTDDPVENASIT